MEFSEDRPDCQNQCAEGQAVQSSQQDSRQHSTSLGTGFIDMSDMTDSC